MQNGWTPKVSLIKFVAVAGAFSSMNKPTAPDVWDGAGGRAALFGYFLMIVASAHRLRRPGAAS